MASSSGKQIIVLRAAEIDIITNETGDLLAVGGLKETSEPNVDRRIVPDVMCASTRKILSLARTKPIFSLIPKLIEFTLFEKFLEFVVGMVVDNLSKRAV